MTNQQKNVQSKYGFNIKHSGIGLFFFGMMYVNYAMNTFSKRVQKASEQAENHVALEATSEDNTENNL